MIKIEDVSKWKKEIKIIHPEDPEYFAYWYEEKRRIIEGYWDEDFNGYRYMPAKLYFFVNHAALIDFDVHRTMNVIIPELWDLHWMYGYISLQSLGFSGFADDDRYTCDNRIREIKKNHDLIPQELLRSNGTFKEYISPLEYGLMLHDSPKGLPLYNNEMYGYTVFGSRGGGKSYWMANGELLHEIVTDGVRYYLPEYREKKPKVRVMIGSGDAAKSSETCSKLKLTMDELSINPKLGVFGKPGDDYYTPSPLYKDMRGSIGPNNKENPWRHEYEVISKGRRVVKGSKSELHHVNYSEMKSKGRGAQAGAGGRYSIALVEEVGLTPLIREAYASNDAVVRIGTNYIGRQLMIGTSENIEIVGPAQNIFENPKDYRMIAFSNEETGVGETGFFLSALYTDKKFKDKNGNTDFEKAKIYYDKIRDDKAKSDNPEILRKEKMNFPIKISEMWLTDHGYYLPYEEAQVREQQLQTNKLYKDLATNVVLSWNPEAERGVSYEIDYSATPMDTWPIPMDIKDQSGCVQIYEFPTPLANGVIPNDMYNCIGYDMYVEEDVNKGGSLGVTIVLKNPKYITQGFTGNIIAAIYVGKPVKGMDYYHEQQEKLLALYGNPIWGLMFEKNRGEACREYYIRKNKINLLAPTPQMRQGNSMYQRQVSSFGFLVGNRISKLNMLKMTRDWLLEETEFMVNGDTKRMINIFRIPNLFLIRQIMMYTLSGNFDGVSALMGCVIALREWETIEEERTKIYTNRVNIFEKYLPKRKNI